MATNDKYQKAVDRATNKTDGGTETAPTIPVRAGAMISKVDQSEINALTASGDYEFAPQVMSLEEGDKVTGILEGNGPDAEFLNKDTGEVRTVQTWIIADPDGGQRVSILSSAQLDRKMLPFVGGLVTVIRGKDLKTSNGHRVTDYLVCGPKLKDGTRRTWARPPVLDVPSSPQAALPAGNSASKPTNAEDLTA